VKQIAKSNRKKRSSLAGPALFIVAALTAVMAIIAMWRPPAEVSQVAAVGGDFALTDVNGATFDSRSLRGKPYAVFFGYTHCPDVCPTALLDVTQALRAIDLSTEDFPVVFITVDPERDKPDVMKRYTEVINAGIIGLTGDPQQIAQTAKMFRVFYRKGTEDGGAYALDHSAMIYLFNRHGVLITAALSSEPQPAMIAKLRRTSASGTPERQ
jgi:protein SCO1/2